MTRRTSLVLTSGGRVRALPPLPFHLRHRYEVVHVCAAGAGSSDEHTHTATQQLMRNMSVLRATTCAQTPLTRSLARSLVRQCNRFERQSRLDAIRRERRLAPPVPPGVRVHVHVLAVVTAAFGAGPGEVDGVTVLLAAGSGGPPGSPAAAGYEWGEHVLCVDWVGGAGDRVLRAQ